jgi:hypothetical protein
MNVELSWQYWNFELGEADGAVSNAHLWARVDNGQGRQYDVSRDGRFLINSVEYDAASSPSHC